MAKCSYDPAPKITQRYIASLDSEEIGNSKLVKLNNDYYSSELTVIGKTGIAENAVKNIETPIIDALENYYNNASVPLHIPGHGKGEGVYPKFRELVGQRAIDLDTTDEFDGLGTLHPADGPIERAQELMAQTFGSSRSFFLINGSTVGNLALALTVTKENKKVLVSRNCHRSIISGLVLTGAIPVWIIPDRLEDWGVWGPINVDKIKQTLDENPDIEVVWITNPTYEGVVSDTSAIAKICKERNITLLVDEAHGCLWKFNKNLPKPALECGADAVVHSLHKTGGSFSQSSVLHVGKNSRINAEELEANLRMLHSTSPSYMLLASLDSARAYLSSDYGLERIEQAVQNANIIRSGLSTLPGVRCLGEKEGINIDPTKIYLTIDGLSGKRLESILEIEYHIEVESATDSGILALSNIGNTKSELEYFWECIKSIVNSKYSDITYLEKTKYMPFHTPEVLYTPRTAHSAPKEKIAPHKSVGRISADVIAECPPGIPVLVPGEKIKKEHLPYLTKRDFIWVMK